MSGADHIVLGSVTIGPAHFPSMEDSMAASILRLEGELTSARDTVLKLRRERMAQDGAIVDLLVKLSEVEAERDFYKAAASKLMSKKPHNGRRIK